VTHEIDEVYVFLGSLARSQQRLRAGKQALAERFNRPTHVTTNFETTPWGATSGQAGLEITLSVGVRLRDERLLDAYVTATPSIDGWTVVSEVQLFDDGPEVLWRQEGMAEAQWTHVADRIEEATGEAVAQLVSIARAPHFD